MDAGTRVADWPSRYLRWIAAQRRDRRTAFVMSAAVLACAVIAVVHFGFDPGANDPYEVDEHLFPVVMTLTAFAAGLPAGFLAALFSSLFIAHYLFASQATPPNMTEFGTLLVEGTVLALVGGALWDALARAGRERDRFRQALDVLPEGIAIVDRGGRVELRNSVPHPLFAGEHLVLTELPRRAPLDERGVPIPFDRLPSVRALAGERVEGQRVQVRLTDDTVQDAIIAAAPLLDDRGRVDGAVTVATDIGAVADFERERSAFFATIGHELRTPLTSLMGFIQMARRSSPDGPVALHLDRAVQHGRTMVRLLDDLRTIAQMESGSLDLETTEVDLSTLAAELMSERALLSPDRQLTIASPSAPVRVRGDRQRIGQVLGNLVENALKYSPSSAPVRVEVSDDGTTGIVRVIDRGPGIPSAEREVIFDRFYRSVAAHTTSGLGIGLAVGRELAVRMNGELLLEASSETGSTFALRLPLVGRAGAS